MPTYTYYVIEFDPKLENPCEVEPEWNNFRDDFEIDEYELERIAKVCAKHCYHQFEVYKDEQWPLTFVIEDDKGNRLGKVVVGMEYSPTFSSTVVEA